MKPPRGLGRYCSFMADIYRLSGVVGFISRHSFSPATKSVGLHCATAHLCVDSSSFGVASPCWSCCPHGPALPKAGLTEIVPLCCCSHAAVYVVPTASKLNWPMDIGGFRKLRIWCCALDRINNWIRAGGFFCLEVIDPATESPKLFVNGFFTLQIATRIPRDVHFFSLLVYHFHSFASVCALGCGLCESFHHGVVHHDVFRVLYRDYSRRTLRPGAVCVGAWLMVARVGALRGAGVCCSALGLVCRDRWFSVNWGGKMRGPSGPSVRNGLGPPIGLSMCVTFHTDPTLCGASCFAHAFAASTNIFSTSHWHCSPCLSFGVCTLCPMKAVHSVVLTSCSRQVSIPTPSQRYSSVETTLPQSVLSRDHADLRVYRISPVWLSGTFLFGGTDKTWSEHACLVWMTEHGFQIWVNGSIVGRSLGVQLVIFPVCVLSGLVPDWISVVLSRCSHPSRALPSKELVSSSTGALITIFRAQVPVYFCLQRRLHSDDCGPGLGRQIFGRQIGCVGAGGYVQKSFPSECVCVSRHAIFRNVFILNDVSVRENLCVDNVCLIFDFSPARWGCPAYLYYCRCGFEQGPWGNWVCRPLLGSLGVWTMCLAARGRLGWCCSLSLLIGCSGPGTRSITTVWGCFPTAPITRMADNCGLLSVVVLDGVDCQSWLGAQVLGLGPLQPCGSASQQHLQPGWLTIAVGCPWWSWMLLFISIAIWPIRSWTYFVRAGLLLDTKCNRHLWPTAGGGCSCYPLGPLADRSGTGIQLVSNATVLVDIICCLVRLCLRLAATCSSGQPLQDASDATTYAISAGCLYCYVPSPGRLGCLKW